VGADECDLDAGFRGIGLFFLRCSFSFFHRDTLDIDMMRNCMAISHFLLLLVS